MRFVLYFTGTFTFIYLDDKGRHILRGKIEIKDIAENKKAKNYLISGLIVGGIYYLATYFSSRD